MAPPIDDGEDAADGIAPERAVGLKELARILNVSYNSVYVMAHEAAIPAFRVGKLWRAFPSRVIQHLAGQRAEPRDVFAQPSRSEAARKAAETRRRNETQRRRDL